MIILGISDSHESHACVLIDGKIIAAAAEERFTRLKADGGYPKNAIDKVIKQSGIKKQDINLVVFAGHSAGLFHNLMKPVALFSVKDWIFQNEKYWKPLLLNNKKLSLLDDFNLFKKKIKNLEKNPYYSFLKKIKGKEEEDYNEIFNNVRKDTVSKHLGINKNKIFFVRHEECHQYYGYYSQANYKDKVLIFTIEGAGDDSSATVSLGENGFIQEIYKTNLSMMGRLYRYTTLLLGMKPCQHEYKIMGLAPYGNEYHGRKCLEHFRKFDKVVGTKIKNQKIFKDVYYSSQNALEGERFDGIAWGLQKYLEETLLEWVTNNVKKYKLKDIILSGGVAQNIKALQVLIQDKRINSVWSGPITGDGSLAIGAVWSYYRNFCGKKVFNLTNAYLGTEIISDKKLKAKFIKLKKKYIILNKYSPKDVAKWIYKGKIVARCEGRMEFGQRALGNRSILADPTRYDTVERINKRIKNRDFWMPFTPTICYENCKKYIEIAPNSYSPYMTMAYNLKKGYENKLPAVIHQADKTSRPQMLKRKDNPDYYDILKEFEKLSGFPVLLNTSFNIHGDAIVENADQAISTLEKTDIDVLLLSGKAIIRK